MMRHRRDFTGQAGDVRTQGRPAAHQFVPPSSAGQRATVHVSYHGIPRAGLRIGKNRHGERTFFSENWPDKARQWLPMVDHPYDKATSEFMVTAPPAIRSSPTACSRRRPTWATAGG